jgi:hypothetical protein
MVGVEEHDKGRHDNDNDMIMLTRQLLPLPPADDLKKKNQFNWENAVSN